MNVDFCWYLETSHSSTYIMLALESLLKNTKLFW